MAISKNFILERVSSYDILNYYLQPYHNHGKLTQGQNISNPFLGQKQDTPSFNIYCKLPEHEWMYNDFATNDKGSCFDLVMKLHSLTFSESLERIANDFNLTNNNPIKPRPPKNGFSFNQSNNKTPYSFIEKPFSQIELAFWAKFNIDNKTLSNYNVISLAEYTGISKTNKEYKVKSSSDNFIFGYKNESWIKIYKPNGEKRFKFGHLGTKEPNFIFGLKQLPQTGDILFITGGEKDVMTLAAHGFNAISLNSETATIEESVVNELKNRFTNILVLYDIDETGKKQSELLATKNGFKKVTLPIIQHNGKDISDYFASNGSLSTFYELVSTAIQTPLQLHEDRAKVFYTWEELMALGNSEPAYLMKPILPQKGLAVIAGKPDIGKSQFARQLCLHVAAGLKSFIDFELNLIHNKAIYVATEDDMKNTAYLAEKQKKGLNIESIINFRFRFADSSEQDELLEQLDGELNLQAADLVVIDSFGDVFKGGDMNSNVAMRKTAAAFGALAEKHNCLFVFVHHINKGAYRQSPAQEHIQGGSGLMQKVRCGIQLSAGENKTRYFTVVKGNYCPKEYKENSMVLNFSEDTFLFENTGLLIPTLELAKPSAEDKGGQQKQINHDSIAKEIFGGQLITYSKFIAMFCEKTQLSEATAKRIHKKLKDSGTIVEVNGSYRLANPREQINSEDYSDEMPF